MVSNTVMACYGHLLVITGYFYGIIHSITVRYAIVTHLLPLFRFRGAVHESNTPEEPIDAGAGGTSNGRRIVVNK